MPPVLDATLWRTHPYTFQGNLWLDKPPIVFACRVNGTITFPVDTIPYDGITTGAYTDCWTHQEVLFGSTLGGDDLGRGRLRKAPDSGHIYIGRSSQGTQDGTCNIVDDSYITVIDSFLPAARIPYIADGLTVVGGITPSATTQFRDFDLDYTVGVNGSPQVNLGYGPGFAANVDPLTNTLTVSFPLVSGLSKGYDSNIAAWSISSPDGTMTGTSPNVTFVFPVGRRHVHFTATDGNGNSTTRHILVVACQDGTAYESIKYFSVSNAQLNLNGNQNTFDVKVYQAIPKSIYPDKMMVIYFEDEWYGGTHGPLNVISPFGQTGCESVKFCGWHFQTEQNTDAQTTGTISEVTLKCLDICGWLDHLPGFPIEVNRKASPTSWFQMKNANMDKYFAEGILYYFSTARFITDWYDTNTGDIYGFARLGSGQQTLYQQIQELADRAIGYELTCNEQGMIYCRPNQNLLQSGSRTNINIVSVNEDDIKSIRHVDLRHPKTHWNRGAAVLSSTVDIDQITTPQVAFAVAPGKAPGQGATATDRNEQLCISAGELFVRTAARDAEDNTDIGDVEFELIHTGDAGIEPAPGQWITISVSAQYATQRGLLFNNTRCRILSATTNRQVLPTGNSKTIKYIGRPETVGVAAVDDTPPVSNVVPAPQAAPPPAPISIGNIGGVSYDGGTVIAMSLDQIGICTNYRSSAAQIWSSRLGTGLPNTDIFLMMIFDPYSDLLIKKSGKLGAWIITRHGLYYTSNILAATGTIWTKQQTLNIREGIIRASTATPGVVYMAHCGNSAASPGPTQAKKLSAYGSTIDWSVQCGSDDLRMTGADIDQYGSDEMLTSGRVGNTAYVYRVIGGTATQLTATAVSCSDPETQGIWFIQKPLKTYAGGNNSSISGSEVLLYNDRGNSKLYSTSNGGVSITDISPSGGVKSFYYTSSIAFTTNSSILAIPNLTNGHIFTSSSAGVSWIDNGGSFLYTSGYYPNIVDGNYALYGGGSILIYSPDFGVSQIDKTGNWSSAIGSISGFFSVIPIY